MKMMVTQFIDAYMPFFKSLLRSMWNGCCVLSAECVVLFSFLSHFTDIDNDHDDDDDDEDDEGDDNNIVLFVAVIFSSLWCLLFKIFFHSVSVYASSSSNEWNFGQIKESENRRLWINRIKILQRKALKLRI